MKAKDLMIGDWVLHKGKPIQVYNVFKDSINETYYAFSNEVDSYIDESEIEQIPLTPEILEKNGFKSNYNEEFTIDDKYSIYMSILNPQYTATPRVMTGDIEDGDGGIYFNLSYVHELQHLLRLCKIEKEIVL